MNIDDMIEEFRVCNYTHFDEFYNLTKKNVFFTIIAIVKDNYVVDDLMQDTYMKFLENINNYKSKSINAYLSTIARNLAINYYNKEKRIIHNDEIIDYVQSDDKAPNYEYIEVLEMLKTLDDTSREIVILHTINDLKFKEIAKIVDKPLGTVLWIYNKAIKELKRKVGVTDEQN
ncbi:MAG: sigma-70 family RNA polymerase sigma factor [Acholeplasmatales bacterium]|nr:sigma-70 family RNA polymerase sigma factor [Acholeplasmatales bacterium]